MKRVYLSGPITNSGTTEEIWKRFDTASSLLRAAGYRVFSPIEHDVPGASMKENAWTAALRRDIEEISRCDCIAILNGFERSKGCMLEVHIALALRLEHILIPSQPTAWLEEVRALMQPSLDCMWRYVNAARYTHHADQNRLGVDHA